MKRFRINFEDKLTNNFTNARNHSVWVDDNFFEYENIPSALP